MYLIITYNMKIDKLVEGISNIAKHTGESE